MGLHGLRQCCNDTQVWRIVALSPKEEVHHARSTLGGVEKTGPTIGLMVAYVDDFLLLLPAGPVRDGLVGALRKLWTMSTEQTLKLGEPFTFLGLEFEKRKMGMSISTSVLG